MQQKFDERNRDLIVNINGKLAAPRRGGREPVRQRGPGRRRRLGRPAALRRPDLRARGASRAPALLRARTRLRRHPGQRGDREGDPPHARGEPDEGRRAHPPDADARREDHLRHGPAPQPVGPDADRARRAQAPGLLEEGPQSGHEQPAPLAARLPRPEDPPRQPALLDPRQDPGERGGRGRRDHAGPARLHRGDERDASFHGA